MRSIATILLFSGLAWAQSESLPKYPLVLTVTSAHVSNTQAGTTTDIMGYLSDDPWKRPVRMVCDVAMSSRGPEGNANTYPARYGYQSRLNEPKHVRIYAREPGKISMREYKCLVPIAN